MVTYSVPPSNSFVSIVLRESRDRETATFSRSAGDALTVLSIRPLTRLASPRLGSSVRMFDGAM